VFMILDDFFLNANVDGARINEAWRQFHELNAVYLRADNLKKAGEHIANTWVCPVKLEQLLYVGLDAVLFQKAYLQKITEEPGLNIWRTQTKLRALARRDCRGHYFIEQRTPALITYVESIKGYFWKPMGIEYLARHGLRPDLNRRPYPPQGQDPFTRLYRSVLKRRMRFVNWLNARLGGRLRPKVIQPLMEAVKPN